MTIKLLLLKSGEDIIADVSEMNVGQEDNPRVVGYFLDKPCIIKMGNPNILTDDPESTLKKVDLKLHFSRGFHYLQRKIFLSLLIGWLLW